MPYCFGEEEVCAAAAAIRTNVLDRYINKELSITRQLEKKFAHYIGAEDSLMVSSGTAALVCSLVGLGVKKGDEVIIPSFTYIATALAVAAVGAVPVVAEIDNTLTISVIDIESKITDKTKFIIPVHMHGYPCDMKGIMRVAKKHKLLVIEDVAQACGGSFDGEKLGNIGDAGAYSFNHFKVITCGEGGALVIKGKNQYKIAEVYHHGGVYFEPGFSGKDMPLIMGNNYRMSEISSAIVTSQLQKLPDILDRLHKDYRFMYKVFSKFKRDWLSFISSNDNEGNCCRTLGIAFATKRISELFLKIANQCDLPAWSMCTPGHICSDWRPLLEANDIKMNDCSDSMALLARTIGISSMCYRTEDDKLHFESLVDKVFNLVDEALKNE